MPQAGKCYDKDMLKRFLLIVSGALILSLALSLGVYHINGETGRLEQWAGQVPLLKDGIAILSGTGEAITHTAMDLLSSGERISKAVQESPVLQESAAFVGRMGQSIVSAGKEGFQAVNGYLFPSIEAIASREQDKATLAVVESHITSKKNQMSNLQQELNALDRQKLALEKKINPFKRLQPDGVNFFALRSAIVPEPDLASSSSDATIPKAGSPNASAISEATNTASSGPDAKNPIRSANMAKVPAATKPKQPGVTSLSPAIGSQTNASKESCSCP